MIFPEILIVLPNINQLIKFETRISSCSDFADSLVVCRNATQVDDWLSWFAWDVVTHIPLESS